MTSEVHIAAIRRASAMLTAAGATYAIRLGDMTYGNAELKEPPRERHDWAPIYAPWLETITEGSHFEHTLDTQEMASKLRNAMTPSVIRLVGSGNYMTTITPVENDGVTRYKLDALIIEVKPDKEAA